MWLDMRGLAKMSRVSSITHGTIGAQILNEYDDQGLKN
jgi:hypothetical protein